MATDKPICRGVRSKAGATFDTLPGQPIPTEPCTNQSVKRGLCPACYERVRAGGKVDAIALPWDRANAKRKKKATNAD